MTAAAHQGAGGAEAVDDPARQRQPDDGAERGGEQGQPELAGREPELVLDVRDPRGEGREGRPVDGEGREDGGAGHADGGGRRA